MNRRNFCRYFTIFFGICAALMSLVAASQTTPTAPLYLIDPVETRARFEVMFLGMMTVHGKFGRTTGTLNHDAERGGAASHANDAIYAVIDSTTLDTNVINANATNQMLRGANFFQVDKYPTIEFKSSRFVWEATRPGELNRLTHIEGSLTMVGTNRPVLLIVQKSGCTPATPLLRARCTADAYLLIRRSDFGIKAWSASVSDAVKIIVELVAYAAPIPTNEVKTDVKKIDESAPTPVPTPSSTPAIIAPH